MEVFMKKLLIFSLIFVLAIVFASNLVYAADIDMNLTSDGIADVSTDGTVYGSEPQNTNTTTSVPTSSNTGTSVGSTAALSSSNLGLSNILNIILIVLGILLVLFAIAILIRMR